MDAEKTEIICQFLIGNKCAAITEKPCRYAAEYGTLGKILSTSTKILPKGSFVQRLCNIPPRSIASCDYSDLKSLQAR